MRNPSTNGTLQPLIAAVATFRRFSDRQDPDASEGNTYRQKVDGKVYFQSDTRRLVPVSGRWIAWWCSAKDALLEIQTNWLISVDQKTHIHQHVDTEGNT